MTRPKIALAANDAWNIVNYRAGLIRSFQRAGYEVVVFAPDGALAQGVRALGVEFHPVPMKALVQDLGRFKQAEMVWCQEEPRNMGSWHFIEPYLEWVLNQIHATHKRPRYVGRPAAAATATGLMSKHLAQLKAFLEEALG